ncbi:hypothetical protein, partial [Pseudomonas sp. 2995-3]|uniref:hypothetical protein n=1 Tax=Pseudomonas sp. 2995-3 TaxID=1712680 RepID=UPI000C48A75A
IDGFNIPIIKAKSIDQISYKEAVAPTLETVDVNKSMEQDGLLISLDKIEFSKNETRVYLSGENLTQDDVFIRQYSAQLFQNSNVYEV